MVTPKEHLLSLIDDFLSRKLEPQSFVNEYARGWSRYRDEVLERLRIAAKGWPEPFLDQLASKLAHGEITETKYLEDWSRLTNEDAFIGRALDAIHSSAMFFEDPDPHYYISEAQLRWEIELFLKHARERNWEISTLERPTAG